MSADGVITLRDVITEHYSKAAELIIVDSLKARIADVVANAISDNREYALKVWPVLIERSGSFSRYTVQALIALRRFSDAEAGEYIWLSEEENKRHSDTMSIPVYNKTLTTDIVAIDSTTIPANRAVFERIFYRYNEETYKLWRRMS